MNKVLLVTIFILLTYPFTSLYSQTKSDQIGIIKSQYEWINSQANFDTIQLNNADFLDHSPDHGGQLTGYFKNDTLIEL